VSTRTAKLFLFRWWSTNITRSGSLLHALDVATSKEFHHPPPQSYAFSVVEIPSQYRLLTRIVAQGHPILEALPCGKILPHEFPSQKRIDRNGLIQACRYVVKLTRLKEATIYCKCPSRKEVVAVRCHRGCRKVQVSRVSFSADYPRTRCQ
jgi:hypothetical protein